MKKWQILIGIVFMIAMQIVTTNVAVAQEFTIENLKAQSIIITQGYSGQILYQKNSDKAVDVGTASKLLVVYIIYDAIEKGKLSLTDKVEISDRAYELSQDYNLANVPLRQDFNYTVAELLEAVALRNANGALLALVESLNMSDDEFIRLMNETLDNWQLSGNHIINITGMSDQYQPSITDSDEKGRTNQFTALSLATIAYHLIKDYPEYLELTSKEKATFKKETDDKYEAENMNPLIKDKAGIKGLTVAISPEDGYSQVMVQEQDENQLIAVVLGVDKSMENPYYAVSEVLKYGINSFEKEHLLKRGEKTKEIPPIKVVNGEKTEVETVYHQDFFIFKKNLDEQMKFHYRFEGNPSNINDKNEVIAPVDKGDVIGFVAVDVEEMQLEYLPMSSANHVEVIANETIVENRDIIKWIGNQLSNLVESFDLVRKFFTNLFN